MMTSAAIDDDVQAYRKTLCAIRRENSWRQDRGIIPQTLGWLNQAAGNPRRVVDAFREASKGVQKYGAAIRDRDRIGKARQFARLYADSFRYGTYRDEFYLFQSYLPAHRQHIERQFPFVTQCHDAQLELIARMAPEEYTCLHDKVRSTARLAAAKIPHIPVLAEFAGGRVLDNGARPLPPIDLFSKPVEGSAGRGVSSWRYNGSGRFVDVAGGAELTTPLLMEHLCRQSGSSVGRILLQARLTNHEAMTALTSGGLATLRVVTCRAPSGALELLPVVLKMPVGKMVQDNLAAGGLAAPIDSSNGLICGSGVRKDSAVGVIQVSQHPDTRVGLRGFPIPFWKETAQLALSAHATFSALPFIGWDVAVTPQGPVVVEGNAPFDVDLSVLPHGISLSDTPFVRLFNYHWARSRPRAGDGSFIADVLRSVRG